MKKAKKKIQKILKNKEIIHFLICLFLLMLVALSSLFLKETNLWFIDVDTLTSLITAFLLTSCAKRIAHYFVDHYEDETKLTNDYGSLIRMYEANSDMFICQNATDSYIKKGRKSTCSRLSFDQKGDTYKLPVTDVIPLRNRNVVIHDDANQKFVPPDFCQKHYIALLNAHDSSDTYNQLALRIEKAEEKNDGVNIWFSRATYFDSLVTNRAIDYKIDSLSIRDIYAHGPFLPSLEDSKLSNHIGFSGMVETSDGMFVMIRRHNRGSIGKRMLQTGVGASLKAKYALDRNGQLSKKGIENAMIQEIIDELSLKKAENCRERIEAFSRSFSFDNNVLFFYRDLLEGGKPQFMIYAKIPFDSKELNLLAKKAKRKHLAERDGTVLFFIDRNELNRLYLAPDRIVLRNKTFPSLPAVVGTVEMMRLALSHGLLKEEVKEAFTLSKKGDVVTNEDALYVGDRFIAVVDGATSKSSHSSRSKITCGRFASRSICRSLDGIPNEITSSYDLLVWINEQLKKDTRASEHDSASEKPLASIILYDSYTHHVISYGDCQALIQGQWHKKENTEDLHLAERRSSVIKEYLNKGGSYQDLLKFDVGRAAIKEELLELAARHANELGGKGFPVLGTGNIISEYIRTYSVKSGEEVVLASDGYPFLLDTLAKSERELEEIVQNDPLLYLRYKSTKGVAEGNVSYDDRTYIRFRVK